MIISFNKTVCSLEACLGVCLPRGTSDGLVVARNLIYEPAVGQQRSCCAYPSTPHWRSLCGDKVLYINHVPRSGSNYRASTGGRFGTAPRYGMGGIHTPQRHFAPSASLALRSVPLWGWGYAKPLRGSRYIHFCWRNGGMSAPVDFCPLCYSR